MFGTKIVDLFEAEHFFVSRIDLVQNRNFHFLWRFLQFKRKQSV